VRIVIHVIAALEPAAGAGAIDSSRYFFGGGIHERSPARLPPRGRPTGFAAGVPTRAPAGARAAEPGIASGTHWGGRASDAE